jgi:hypothetical protein
MSVKGKRRKTVAILVMEIGRNSNGRKRRSLSGLAFRAVYQCGI